MSKIITSIRSQWLKLQVWFLGWVFTSIRAHIKSMIQNQIELALEPMSRILVRFKKLNPKVKTPTKAYEGDAGLDLYATERMYIPSGEWRVVKTGLAFEIPEGWHMQIHTRSSYGKLRLRCHLGIIDAGYRNEVLVMLFNDGMEDFILEEGSKFCQAVFLPVPLLKLEETDQLNDSHRGQGGFGSSGK